MGKTSLIVRTVKKLVAEGFACTSLDFSVRGSRNVNSEQEILRFALSAKRTLRERYTQNDSFSLKCVSPDSDHESSRFGTISALACAR